MERVSRGGSQTRPPQVLGKSSVFAERGWLSKYPFFAIPYVIPAASGRPPGMGGKVTRNDAPASYYLRVLEVSEPAAVRLQGHPYEACIPIRSRTSHGEARANCVFRLVFVCLE